MKKAIAVFLSALALLIGASAFSQAGDKRGYVRIRIIANSDSAYDQNLKLLIRNELVDGLGELLDEADSREEAIALLKGATRQIKEFCDKMAKDAGYGSAVAVREELFPQKSYGGEVYPEGAYAALVITLGRGEGSNWWCVAYPPLCFVNGTPNPDAPDKVTYRSFLIEWLAGLLKGK